MDTSSKTTLSYDLEGGQPRGNETGESYSQEDVERASEEEKIDVKKDPNLVDWDGPDDPDNPQNWTRSRKWVITVVLSIMSFSISFASSVFSTATAVTSEKFGVSNVVMTLGTSLFVLGFATGPVIFGPFSEVFGRKMPLFAGWVGFAVFQIPVAVAQNVETIMLCRYIGGVFASAPLAVCGGMLADMWDPVERTYAVCSFAAGTFGGPVGGPVMGGFITQSYLGWRWTAWITLIMGSFFGIVGFFVVPETHAPKILQTRAHRIRFETRNWAIHAKADETKVSAKAIVNVYILRPYIMLIREPILFLVTLYMSFVYGMLYLFFEAYPVTFIEDRGWNEGVGSLPFISNIIGIGMGIVVIVISTRIHVAPNFRKTGRVTPEDRLPPMMLGAVILPVGLFWFGWTSSPHITWVPQVLAGIPVGMGLFVTFWQGMNYIIDCYAFYSNSAISANTLVRSLSAGAFPLFATAMYHKLGVPWASSLLGFLCVAFVPVPFLFHRYGAKIRSLSKFNPANG